MWWSGTPHHAYQKEQNDCAHNCHKHTGQIKAGHSGRAEDVCHKEASDDGTHNANDDVGKSTHLSILTHDHACDPSGKRPKYDPNKPIHFYLRSKLVIG
jgi:hypothetical protein